MMKSEEFIIQAIRELNENMEKGFREMRKEMNDRFEEVNKRLERIEKEQRDFRQDISFLSKKIGEHELVLNRVTGQ